MTPHILMGKTIVITRPAAQALPLSRQIQAMGGKTLITPTLEILPPANDFSLKVATRALSQYQILIFVSANAVRYTAPYCQLPLTVTTIAVGPGTARALRENHMPVSWEPEQQHSSEGLLMIPALQNVTAAKIAIFCGENTRHLLKDSLTARGATVDEIVCYRRRCPVFNAAQTVAGWKKIGVNLIISTSMESFENLWRLFADTDLDWLLQTSLMVISPAMAERAQALGFQKIVVAEGAADQAVCAALAVRH